MRARAPPKPKPRALSGRVRGAPSGTDPIKVGGLEVFGRGTADHQRLRSTGQGQAMMQAGNGGFTVAIVSEASKRLAPLPALACFLVLEDEAVIDHAKGAQQFSHVVESI